jgi:hypothetical protein
LKGKKLELEEMVEKKRPEENKDEEKSQKEIKEDNLHTSSISL